jgi:hypothetical protein
MYAPISLIFPMEIFLSFFSWQRKAVNNIVYEIKKMTSRIKVLENLHILCIDDIAFS